MPSGFFFFAFQHARRKNCGRHHQGDYRIHGRREDFGFDQTALIDEWQIVKD
jgi:hypothetical protein